MSDLVRISASWALWGKRPGANDDYSILASSSQPLGNADFARILAHFAPGTPPTERGLPGSLPWITISRVGVGDQFYLGIAIQEMTSQVDGAGRPITQTSYFCVPYAEVANAPISYADFYRGVAELKLPYEKGDAIELNVPPFDAGALSDDIAARFGEAQVSVAAALLLAGSVSVIGSDGSDVGERLRFLDAVAALLPYGYRTWYTAATWSDSGARHRIRLAFAARPREDAAVIRWRSAPEPVPTSSPAELYLQQLRRFRQRDPSPAGLTALISFLAQQPEPRKFEQPQYAIESVSDFDRPFRVLDELHQGRIDTAEIRQVFATSQISQLPAAGRETLLAQLISFGDPQDWPMVEQWWDCIASADPAAMLPTLVAACRQLLWSPAPNRAIRGHLTLAANYGLADALLAGIVAPPASGADLTGGLGFAAQLLADSVFAELSEDLGYPQTQAALVGNPLLACELLVHLAAASAPAIHAALAWMDPVLGEFLRPFSSVLGDQVGAVDAEQLDQLAGFDAQSVHDLLQAASYANRLDRVLPGFARWLTRWAIEAPAPEPAQTRSWRDRAWALAPADAVSRAWLDLALLVSGNPPRSVLTGQGDQRADNRCFIVAWQTMTQEYGAQADDLIATALIRRLSQPYWTADPASAAAVIDLMEQLAATDRRPQLEAVVAGVVSAAPEAANWEFARQWLEHMQQTQPGAVHDGTIFAVSHPPPDATAAELAESCLQAFRNGLDPEHAARLLAESGVVGSGEMAVAILRELRDRLSPRTGEAADLIWLEQMAVLFADGTFGRETADQFRSQTISDSLANIRYQVRLLHIVTAAGGVPPELAIEDVQHLEEAQKAVDQTLRQIKKRRGWLMARVGKPSSEKPDSESDGGPKTESADTTTTKRSVF